VVEPYVRIVSPDGSATPKILGYFLDPTDENQDPTVDNFDPTATGANSGTNYSENAFEVHAGDTVKLKPEYHPSFLDRYVRLYEWTLDGKTIEATSDGSVTFTAGEEGTKMQVGVKVYYSPNAGAVSSLQNRFKSPADLETLRSVAHSIQISTFSSATASTPQGKLFAALAANLPSQLLFLIRVVLTMGVTLVTVGILFALFPEYRYAGRRTE
jgi:hypothetical protein